VAKRSRGSVLLKAAALLGVCAGLAGGIGSYTFFYAKGASYMTNAPEACANCHVMGGHYDAWRKSSHHAVAVCNDCHTPHDLIGKYYVKGRNGYHHSLAFTSGRFHEPIQITPFNEAVAEANCRYCHQEIVDAIDPVGPHASTASCIHCHKSVGHLE